MTPQRNYVLTLWEDPRLRIDPQEDRIVINGGLQPYAVRYITRVNLPVDGGYPAK
jgi:hypothetical protein